MRQRQRDRKREREKERGGGEREIGREGDRGERKGEEGRIAFILHISVSVGLLRTIGQWVKLNFERLEEWL